MTLSLLLLPLCLLADAREPATAFDPTAHLSVADVRPGMKGHGLTVFSGVAIERFDVEVVSVVPAFNAGMSVILIRCDDERLRHTGIIAGMSGSPVYLTDDAGRSRLAGAVAYGWGFAKDPIAGVQPIEYMLRMPTQVPAGVAPRVDLAPRLRRRDDAPLAAAVECIRAASARPLQRAAPTGLRPLATPIMAAGLPTPLVDRFGPLFEAAGLSLVQSGAAGGGVEDARLAPGSVLAAPLLTGDLELTAIGTCTAVIGERVYGFGHPLFSEGAIQLPLAAGSVHVVLPTIVQSFKLGSASPARGTLSTDHTAGVAGRLGAAPETTPIEVRVVYADGSLDRVYRYQAARHTVFTPVLTTIALISSATGDRGLPPDHSLDLDVDVEIDGRAGLSVQDRAVAVGNAEASTDLLVRRVLLPLMLAGSNDVRPLSITAVRATMRVDRALRGVRIESAALDRRAYRPGEAAQVLLTTRRIHGGIESLRLALPLPHDLPAGEYALTVGDADTAMGLRLAARPGMFDPRTPEELRAMLNDVSGLDARRVYLHLQRDAAALSLGPVALPRLPSSRRQVALAAARPGLVAGISAIEHAVDVDDAIAGAAQLTLRVDPALPARKADSP